MKIYQGIVLPRQRIVQVINGSEVYALPNWEQGVNPDFNWGYGGSGPSSLAKSIVLDLFPDADFTDPDEMRSHYLLDNIISNQPRDKGFRLSEEEAEGGMVEHDIEPHSDLIY